ncbi:MAG: hypothetical protein SHS37scaffold145_61 [Phage 71_18]|nr:MAG: hypothetical protein SHS37scaffold145_61 [Phage 71_18]
MRVASTEYRLTDAPKHAGMRDHDCARCTAESLKRPVWLTGPVGAQAYGTRCAAIMLGLVPEATTEAAARKALKPLQDEATRLAAVARRAEAAARDAAWQVWLDEAAGPGDRIEQISRLGGITAAHLAYATATATATAA